MAHLEGKNIDGSVKAKYLLGIISFNLTFENMTLKYALKVFGIKTPIVFDGEVEQDEELDIEEDDELFVDLYDDDNVGDTKVIKKDIESPKEIKEETKEESGKDDHISWDDYLNDDLDNDSIENDIDEDIGKSVDEELNEDNNDIFKKISSFFNNINKKIKDIYKKIHSLWVNFIEKKNYVSMKYKRIKKYMSRESSKEAFRTAKRMLFSLIKHILPNKIKLDANIGFDSPDKTGKALGGIGMFMGIFKIKPEYMNVVPDFENEVINIKCQGKGRIFLIIVLYYATRLYFNKVIRFFKHEFLK